LTPTSYGVQPHKFIFIENKELREKLVPVSWNQKQVVDASHLIVMCYDKSGLSNESVGEFISNVASTRGINRDDLKGYEDMINGTVAAQDDAGLEKWQSNQLYIALGQLMAVCATLKIDSCPMEGFDNAKYDEILGLNEKGLKSVVIIPVGYRAEEDVYQNLAKVRKSIDDLVLEM